MGLSDTLRNIEAEIAAGHPEQALALCQELQTRYPRALAVQRVLGEAYLALRKPREALGALDRALAGNPEDTRACCARAIVQQIHGDAASALSWYRRACDLTPDDQILRAAYRELAMSQGQPAYRPTRLGLARLYMRSDLLSHATREWEMLLYETPDALEAQVGLAETLWRAQHFPAAAEHCERILINAPSCVKALLILAVIAHDAGNMEEAQRLARRTADLDPDCRIGQSLFADRLAAGDHALRVLLLGEEAASAREAVTSRPINPSTPLRTAPTTRPAQPSQPSQPLQPLPEPAMFRSAPVPSQPLATTSATTTTSANLRGIFAETEYMLWGKDADSGEGPQVTPPMGGNAQLPPNALRPPTTSAGLNQADTAAREDQFARSSVFVPPVLRDQGTGLDETETRSSINFVNWLQAQGAVQHDGSGALSGPLQRPQTGQSGQLPATAATGSQQRLAPSVERLAVDWETPTGQTPAVARPGEEQNPAGEAEPATSEDLRQMFAELDPETSSQRAVDLANVNQLERKGGNGSGGLDGLASGMTLEQLEQQFTGAGFQQVGLRENEPATVLETSATQQEPVLLMPKEEAEPADYPARLTRARQRRDDGEVDGALADYRLVLRNAPDLLNDVMSDLNETLDESPDHPEVHRLLGDAHIRQGNYLQALEAYNRAVALTQAQNG